MSIPFEEFKSENTIPTAETSGDSEIDLLTGEGPQPLYYMSLGSGSSGNCCYVGTDLGGIIIDAGVRPDIVWERLRQNGISASKVFGVCLTHDHSDHIRYAYSLVRRRQHMRVYCTNRVLNAMMQRHGISKRIKDYHTPVFKEFTFKIANIELTPFAVPHDAADNMGFFISFGGKNMVVATDLGEVTERADNYMRQADYLVIESNYDLRMLLDGKYPMYLKSRIQSDIGHMDNSHTAQYLANLTGINKRLKYIFLCHLSKDNNTPEKALTASRNALEATGLTVGMGNETIEDRACDVQLMVLPRYESTRLFRFI